MKKQKTLWLLIFSISVTLSLLAYFIGIWNFIALNDITYLSFAIIGIYYVSSIFFGYKLFFNKKMENDNYWFISDFLTAIGMLGTIVGMMFVFIALGSINLDNIQPFLHAMGNGLFIAQMTTVLGFITSWFLRFQIMAARKDEIIE